MARLNFIGAITSSSDNDDIIERIRQLELSAIEVAEGVSNVLEEKEFYFKSDNCVFDLEFSEKPPAL